MVWNGKDIADMGNEFRWNQVLKTGVIDWNTVMNNMGNNSQHNKELDD